MLFKPQLTEKQIRCFWSKINICGEDECWEWQASTTKKGYGQQSTVYSRPHSHRLSYFLQNGSFENSLKVCHSCDNPKCCNPKHLFLGTNQDNMDDRNSKNRQSKGENRPSSKLTETQVLEIHQKYATGNYTQQQLADKYLIDASCISRIIHKLRWKHLKNEKLP